MRVKSIRRCIAMAAAVSCMMGTGAAVYGEGAEKTSISWWICPTGAYDDEEKVQSLVRAFEEDYPQIEVEVRILDERKGAGEIETALDAEDGPDVVLAAPEDIVTNWGNAGRMEDLSALWDEKTQSEFRSEMRDTAKNREGAWYAVPLFRDVFSMAINYDVFQEAGALQYLNEEVHSWKDNGFIDAVLRVHDVLVQNAESEGDADDTSDDASDDTAMGASEDGNDEAVASDGIVGKVYCKDEIGQRAFMCFVSNFFNTGLVDEYRSSFQIGSGKICDVFTTLRKLSGKGIEYDPQMNGDDENEAFLNGEVFLTFNWNPAKQKAAMEQNGGQVQHIFPMMYPNAKNTPFLTGTVGALGVNAAKDQKQKDAAMSFVRYLMTDEDMYRDSVLLSGCFPARRRLNGRDLDGLYGDDQTMQLYETFNEYYGTYEPTMELYSGLDQAWPQFLRDLADGAKIKAATEDLEEELNEKLEEECGIKPIEIDEEA